MHTIAEKELLKAERDIVSIENQIGLLKKQILNIEQGFFDKTTYYKVKNPYGCGGCLSKKTSFINRKREKMDTEMLKLQLNKIKTQCQERVDHRIELTKKTINFLEAHRGQMCGGCVQARIDLLNKKVAELEKQKF